MRVVDLTHKDSQGAVLYKAENIRNRIHLLGEDFILKVLFGGVQIPNLYFIGLDSRESISPEDSIADLEDMEPSSYGYERKSINSDDFSVIQNPSGFMQANSPTVLFTALGNSWGPIRNIFLSTGLGHSSPSILVSSASIGQNLIVSPGDTVSMRMAMSLSSC